MKPPRPSVGQIAALVVVAGICCAVPLWLSVPNQTIYVLICLYAIVATGLSLLMGYAGQVSIGQAGFFAIGAYTSAMLSTHGVPSVPALLVAPVMAAAIASIVGIPILRLRGPYLAFATLAFQIIVVTIIENTASLGGSIGIQSIPPLGIGPATLSTSLGYCWLSVGVLAVTLALTRNIIGSRAGRGLRALATSEVAAESAGVPVGRYRLVVFTLAAGFAGLAGGIYPSFFGFVTPETFSVLLAVDFIVMVVIGGLGTIWGGVVGSAVLTVLVQVLNNVGTQPGMPVDMPTILSYGLYGVVLILFFLFLPSGVVPLAFSAARRASDAVTSRLGRRIAPTRPHGAAPLDEADVPALVSEGLPVDHAMVEKSRNK